MVGNCHITSAPKVMLLYKLCSNSILPSQKLISLRKAIKKDKDYLNAAGATGFNHAPFAVLVFCSQRSGSFTLGQVQGFPTK